MPFYPKGKKKGGGGTLILIASEYGSVQPGALDFGGDLSARLSKFSCSEPKLQ